jgi:type I restriction enzyme R subunit
MMTTGYDCQDILNLCLMRPIFSPADFVQIKGRGTRKYSFNYTDSNNKSHNAEKYRYKLFDFFANCEYFEEKFNYDEVLKLPVITGDSENGGGGQGIKNFTLNIPDNINTIRETPIDLNGMKIDRQLFQQAKQTIAADNDIKTAVENEQWDKAIQTLCDKYENKPNLYLTLDKIKTSENLDRRITWREVLERIFGLIDRFPSKDEKLDAEIEKFIISHQPDSHYINHIRNFMKAYILDENFRKIINTKEYAELNTYAGFNISEFKALGVYRDKIPDYIKNHIPLNQFMN